jgi:lipid-A-disaccharide synthase
MLPTRPRIDLRVGGLDRVLAQADLAIAASGTVTMECAFFGVPTVVLYKVGWLEFEVARRLVRVKHIAMPNLLADETVFPEFIQNHATPATLAGAALEFLNSPERREQARTKLARVIGTLGGPGAAGRAARAVVKLLERS